MSGGPPTRITNVTRIPDILPTTKKSVIPVVDCIYLSNHSIIRVTLNTESDTACLFPMASKLTGSNVTIDP